MRMRGKWGQMLSLCGAEDFKAKTRMDFQFPESEEFNPFSEPASFIFAFSLEARGLWKGVFAMASSVASAIETEVGASESIVGRMQGQAKGKRDGHRETHAAQEKRACVGEGTSPTRCSHRLTVWYMRISSCPQKSREWQLESLDSAYGPSFRGAGGEGVVAIGFTRICPVPKRGTTSSGCPMEICLEHGRHADDEIFPRYQDAWVENFDMWL